MDNWVVYLLKCRDNSFYCGATNNLEKRIEAHNSGKGAKYTSGRLPVELAGYKGNLEKSQAMKLELRVKKMNKWEKLEFFRN
ncbi:MAG: GIY-YIG nuclease family protein [Candidatus Nanoarchaeia archaeon]|nr:GIY-YIG nuclease family protein [Candidatus Nanoarchaeia archaeon]